MFVPRLRTLTLALAASLGLSACAYDDGYGYGGVSVGYGGYYGDYYGDPYYGYDYPSYYGWYGGYYYPGSGYWLYDRHGRRHRWNDSHRRHWEHRRHEWRRHHGDRDGRANWGGYRRGAPSAGVAPSSPPSGSYTPRPPRPHVSTADRPTYRDRSPRVRSGGQPPRARWGDKRN